MSHCFISLPLSIFGAEWGCCCCSAAAVAHLYWACGTLDTVGVSGRASHAKWEKAAQHNICRIAAAQTKDGHCNNLGELYHINIIYGTFTGHLGKTKSLHISLCTDPKLFFVSSPNDISVFARQTTISAKIDWYLHNLSGMCLHHSVVWEGVEAV